MRFILPFFLSFILLGCSEENEQQTIANEDQKNQSSESNSIAPTLENLNWMVGNWIDTSTYSKQNGHYIEVWKQSEDSLYSNCKAIKGNDTTLVAYRSIQMVEDKPVFIENIPNRPMVSYRFDSIFKNGIRFENKAQNFPIQITYNRNSNDSLTILLYGITGQFERTGSLLFKKF